MAIRTMFIVTLAATIYIPLHTQAQQISFGKEYWYKEYLDVHGQSLITISDGGYIICGNDKSQSSPKSNLFRIDSVGNILWLSKIRIDSICSIISLCSGSGNHFLIFGGKNNSNHTNYNLFIQKRDINNNTFNTTLFDLPSHGGEEMISINNHEYAFCGQVYYSLFAPFDGFVCKIDSSYNILWLAYANDGCDTTNECITKICQLTDGSFMATGWSRSNATMNLPYNLFVAHISADGQILNTRVFLPWHPGYSNTGKGICTTTDGNVLVLSHEMHTPGLSWQICLYKITPQCDTLWTKFVPGPTGYGSSGFDMRKTSDGGFLIAGSAYLDYTPYAMIARLDSEGNQLWAEAHDNGNSMTFMVNVTETLDKGAAAIGRTNGASADHIYFLKTDTLGLVTGRQDVLPLGNDFQLSPNPAKHSCRLQFMSGTRLIQLFDLQGRQVLNQSIKQGQTSVDISLTHLPAGIYLLHVLTANHKMVKKLVKM